MKIWLDDERPAPPGWCWCRTAAEASRVVELAIARQDLQAVSLDHDLGENLPTGYDVALQLERARYDGRLAGWFRGDLQSHSANPVGRARIMAALRRAL